MLGCSANWTAASSLESTPPPDRFERLNQILNDALELPPAEREPFILRACGQDETLRHSAQSLFRRFSPDEGTTTISSALSLRAGDVLEGGYRILHLVGRGGMGEVYEAEDPEMDEHVAIKTIRPEIAADEASVVRFRKEIQLGRRVSHPNVCNIYSIGKHGSVYFFSMELLRGETLSARLKRCGRMELAEAQPLLCQMADALSAAHDAGIIHRDFKPANVMLLAADTKRKAVITDFGLARLAERPESDLRTGGTHFAGTPMYMAPEQLEDAPLTKATDIYALGLVAYEMVTAHRPFEGARDISAALQKLTGTPPAPAKWVSDLDARWNAAILRCLERDPANRWESACEFVEALSESAAPPPQVVKSPKPKTASNHWWRWGAVAVLVVALAIAGWLLQRPPAVPAPAQEWLEKGTASVRDGVYWKATKQLGSALDLDRDLPLAYARLAEAWNEMDDPDQANTKMAAAHAHPSDLNKTDRLYVDAINFTVSREFAKAVKAYQIILDRLPDAQKHFGHVDLGRAYEKNAESPKALIEYKLAIEERGDWPCSWLRRGVLERNLSMLPKARADLTEALRLFRKEGDSEGRAQAMFELARMSPAADAEKLLTEAQSLAGENLFQKIAIQLELSSVAANGGRLEDAKRLAFHAKSVADENGMPVLGARSLIDFAGFLVRIGSPEAKEKFQSALETATRLHAERQEYGALFNLGSLESDDDDLQKAKIDLDRSRSWFASHAYLKEAALADSGLARIDRKQGNYQSALKRLQTAMNEAADDATRSSVFRDLASVYLIEEDFPGAHNAGQKARQLDSAVGNKAIVAADDERIGTSLAQSGDPEGATAALDRAAKEGLPESEVTLDRAEASLASGQYAAASQLSKRVPHETKDKDDLADAYRIGCLALARSGNARKGKPLCVQAVAAAKSLDQGRYSVAKLALAYVELMSGNHAASFQITTELFPELENHNQQSSLWRCLVYRAEAARVAADKAAFQETLAKAQSALEKFTGKMDSESKREYLNRADVTADLAAFKSLQSVRN